MVMVEGNQIGTGMDRAKRAPPPAAAERSAKKPCCHRDPSGGVPEISSLLSSLSVAKRHSPASPPAGPLNKRPRYDHHDALHARMRALEISCETTDMEQDKEQELDWAGFLPELLRLVCDRLPLADVPRFGAVCRHWRSCAFPVYPADAAPVLLSAPLTAAGAVRCYSPHLHKIFVLAAPPLPQGSRLFSAAAGGWVMLNTPSRTVVLANLLDGSVHETPKREAGDQGFMCSSPRPRRRHHGDDGCFDVLAVFSGMGTVRVESWVLLAASKSQGMPKSRLPTRMGSTRTRKPPPAPSSHSQPLNSRYVSFTAAAEVVVAGVVVTPLLIMVVVRWIGVGRR